VGDSGVGKTSFLDAISSTLGTVVENEESTELHIKTTYYIDDAYQYKIVYFDMPGKERHHKYIHKYVNGSTACIYMFNVTKRSSFEKMEQWIQETQNCETLIRIMVGNMVDLTTNPNTQKTLINPVSKVEAIALARKYDTTAHHYRCKTLGQAQTKKTIKSHRDLKSSSHSTQTAVRDPLSVTSTSRTTYLKFRKFLTLNA